ncbi:winged helix DNA-binding domain-containing protein [bacterium]|nr:winged helix DNA-binding domain-containing protein [bacterium]
MKNIQISLASARKLALNAQLLNKPKVFPNNKEGVLQVIDNLGYVQIDTIAVVQRAHHHTLWNRCQDYNPVMLHELQVKDRRIFEYWGHALSFLPMSDYRFYLPCMDSYNHPSGKWEKDRLEKYGHLMEPTLERIRVEGALSSKDFETPAKKKGCQWTHPKPVKAALELLFWQGKLMISERHNFQRVFDLTERVLPDDIDLTYPSDDELGEFLVRRALSVHGIAKAKEIAEHIHAADKKLILKSLSDLTESGKVLKVKLENDTRNDYYVLPDTLENISKCVESSKRVILLSPFDNLIIQRDRLKWLFGFEYAVECYVPAAKRKYGFFILPVLWGDRFIGRLDSKADRKTKTLNINNLYFETGFVDFEEFIPQFKFSLTDFAVFNECDNYIVEKVTSESRSKEILKIVNSN